jgi:hypothetical protein
MLSNYTQIASVTEYEGESFASFGVFSGKISNSIFFGTDGNCQCCSAPWVDANGDSLTKLTDMVTFVQAARKWGRDHDKIKSIAVLLDKVMDFMDGSYQKKVSEAKAVLELRRREARELIAQRDEISKKISKAMLDIDAAQLAYNKIVD